MKVILIARMRQYGYKYSADHSTKEYIVFRRACDYEVFDNWGQVKMWLTSII